MPNQIPFSITFGQEPINFIDRNIQIEQIVNDFKLDYPLSRTYIITGVRGSGKTVTMTKIAKTFKNLNDWIVIDINPNRDMLEQIAASIYENESVKHLFLETSFSFSFHGFSFSIEGKEPVTNIKSLLEKMLKVIEKKRKKILLLIDEVTNSSAMRSFVHDYQSLLREDYSIYLLMTGLVENVESLQNSKGLTFLYRTPKIHLSPLNKELIINSYEKILQIDNDESLFLASLTKGYAFAYQVIGFLYYKYHDKNLIIPEYDLYLKTYVYDKVWSSLPLNEQLFLKAFDGEKSLMKDIMNKTGFNQKEYSVYRDRLIRRGIIDGSVRNVVSFTLPRFSDFVNKQI